MMSFRGYGKGMDLDDGRGETSVSSRGRTSTPTAKDMKKTSLFQFKNISFVAGKGEKQKHILNNINGKVRSGHVLAIMGPSGAGKTTLISTLTLEAYYGKPSGSVTLNGAPMKESLFKKHAFVVKQHDKHWPYLTARETLKYAAQLYEVGDAAKVVSAVDGVLTKMGLNGCADTKCCRLSGGQQRRLSLAIALLKSPTLLFLDEPTSGLDAAAASNIMQEILRVSRQENLVILCTIHQPSTKVYEGFDEIMLLSKGREAFTGPARDAMSYFKSIGYPLPPRMNPAEHFLTLVNSDFSSHEEVDKILNAWEDRSAPSSMHGKSQDNGQDERRSSGIHVASKSTTNEIANMFHRHFWLILRDPVPYQGRCIIFLFCVSLFSVVYWKARENIQSQALNKAWLSLWFVGIPSQMGVVAVYYQNDELKNIQAETKNGMIKATSYILAKSILTVPMIFLFGLFALGIPAFVIQGVPFSAFPGVYLTFCAVLYLFECTAEFFAIAFKEPIMGMLTFMAIWFGSFLFGGFLIALEDMFWPFKLFYYTLSYSYYVRSITYSIFTSITWPVCIPEENPGQPVCVDSSDGKDVLDALSTMFYVSSSENRVAQDILIVLGMAFVWKALSIIAMLHATRKFAKIHPLASSKSPGAMEQKQLTDELSVTKMEETNDEEALNSYFDKRDEIEVMC